MIRYKQEVCQSACYPDALKRVVPGREHDPAPDELARWCLPDHEIDLCVPLADLRVSRPEGSGRGSKQTKRSESREANGRHSDEACCKERKGNGSRGRERWRKGRSVGEPPYQPPRSGLELSRRSPEYCSLDTYPVQQRRQRRSGRHEQANREEKESRCAASNGNLSAQRNDASSTGVGRLHGYTLVMNLDENLLVLKNKKAGGRALSEKAFDVRREKVRARKTDELGDLLEELVPSLLPLGVLVVRNASFALPLGLADENARRCALGSGSLTQLLPSSRAETQGQPERNFGWSRSNGQRRTWQEPSST